MAPSPEAAIPNLPILPALWFALRSRNRSLARLIADCAAADANVVEVEHMRHDANLLIDEVDILIQLETKGPQHCQDVLTSLRSAGYRLKFS